MAGCILHNSRPRQAGGNRETKGRGVEKFGQDSGSADVAHGGFGTRQRVRSPRPPAVQGRRDALVRSVARSDEGRTLEMWRDAGRPQRRSRSKVCGGVGAIRSAGRRFSVGRKASSAIASRPALSFNRVCRGRRASSMPAPHGTMRSARNARISRTNISSLSTTSWKPKRRVLVRSDITSQSQPNT